MSTVVLQVFLSRTSLSRLVQFWRHCIKLTRACYFQIALETMLLLILSTPTFEKILLICNLHKNNGQLFGRAQSCY